MAYEQLTLLQQRRPARRRRAGNGPPVRSVSIGGGVQSTVLALLADAGEFGPRPDVGLWADTGWDPPHVRATVEWIAGKVSYPVETVQASRGSLADHTARAGAYYTVPAHAATRDGRVLLGRRRCTAMFKLDPIHRRLAQVAADAGSRNAESWLGITTDEVYRMKPSVVEWCPTRWPLIEQGWSRHDCLEWWKANAPAGAPQIRRSSCVGCPYHSSDEWAELGRTYPREVEEAGRIEAEMQARVRRDRPDAPMPWLHRRRIPLAEAVAADMAAEEARGVQGVLPGEALAGSGAGGAWAEECEGVCGV